MTLRQYITIMILSSLLCWVSLVFVVMNVDPFAAGATSFFFFYISLFLSLLGTISLILFGGYSLLSRQPLPMFRYVQRSFRDGLTLALILTVLLYMQGKGWLHFWNTIVLVSALISLSIFLFFTHKYRRAV